MARKCTMPNLQATLSNNTNHISNLHTHRQEHKEEKELAF